MDRNPLVFEYILDYLQGDEVHLEDLNKRERRKLFEDAKFYQLPGLLEHLAEKQNTSKLSQESTSKLKEEMVLLQQGLDEAHYQLDQI